MKKVTVTFNTLPHAIEDIADRLQKIENAIVKMQTAKNAPDDLLNVKEAAFFLKLKPATIYGLVHKGEIPHSLRGKRLIFSRNRLIEWSLAGERKPLSETRKAAITRMYNASPKNKKNI